MQEAAFGGDEHTSLTYFGTVRSGLARGMVDRYADPRQRLDPGPQEERWQYTHRTGHGIRTVGHLGR